MAAFEVFVEAGYEGATMLEIATRARVSKLTLYALFRDKEGLLEALIAWGAGRTALEGEAVLAEAEADPLGALERYAIACTRVMARWQSLALLRIAIGQKAERPQIAAAHHALTGDVRTETLAALAARLETAGLIEAGESRHFAADLLALMRGELFYDALAGAAPAPTKTEVERHVRRVLARLLRAYAPAGRAKPARPS